jgi:hypothetical protein
MYETTSDVKVMIDSRSNLRHLNGVDQPQTTHDVN